MQVNLLRGNYVYVIFNYISELDVGDAWELDDDDDGELSCYGGEDFELPPEDEIVTVSVDKRKSSTGSQVSCDSLDSAEAFEPVKIDLPTVRAKRLK